MYLKTTDGRFVLVRTFRRLSDGCAHVIAGAGEVLRLMPEDALRLEGRMQLGLFEPIYPVTPLPQVQMCREAEARIPTEYPAGFVAPDQELPCY